MPSPCVTFALLAYNQERFIREAVDGALAQTYSPLEIILSDDCSPDRTFEIMQEMAAIYKGPHKIVLNRNSVNLGFISHLRHIAEVANGGLLILSAGDDVSHHERAKTMFEAWKRTGFKKVSIYSGAVAIDEDGQEIKTSYDFTCKSPGHCSSVEEVLANDNCAVLGATQAVAKELFTEFPKIHDCIYREDNVLPFRALLCNGIVFVEKPLVRYRHHRNNLVSTLSSGTGMNRARRREALTKDYADKYFTRKQWVEDILSRDRDKVSQRTLQGLKRLIMIREYQYRIATSKLFVALLYLAILILKSRRLRGGNIFLYKYLGKNLNQLRSSLRGTAMA